MLVFLTGCAGSNRVALNQSNLPQNTEVKILVPYDEPIIQSKPKHLSHGANGAFGDLLDANAIAIYQSRIETETSGLYKEIVDVDLRSVFSNAMQSELGNQSLLSNASYSISSGSISLAGLSEYKSQLTDNTSSLLMRVRHEFSSDGKSLIGVAGFYWMTANQTTPIYQNVLFYVSKPIQVETVEQAYASWFANHGEKLQAAYVESAHSFTRMLSIDFKDASNETLKANASSSGKNQKVTIPIIKGFPLIRSSMMPPGLVPDGVVLEEDEIKRVIRGNYNSSMYWIGK